MTNNFELLSYRIEEKAQEVKSVDLRSQIKQEVIQLLEDKAKCTFAIASKLSEVKEDFENTSDYIAWCKDELALAKASVYNYLKLHKTFGGNQDFVNVSVRVLNELSRYKNLKDIMPDAESLAKAGELNTKACMKLIDDNELRLNPEKLVQEIEPEKEQESPVTDKQYNVMPEQEKPVQDSTEPMTGIPSELPWDTSADDKPESDTSALLKQIEALTEQLAEANKQIMELSKNTERSIKQSSAPSLPQFKSSCLYARLGLGQVESNDKARVKKAYRELVKVGYGIDHKDHDAIKLAFTELTK